MTKHKPSEEYVDGPAKLHAGHVRDRALSKNAGAKTGWRKISTLDRAYESGKLVDKERCIGQTPAAVKAATEAEKLRAHNRYLAAKDFERGWLIANAGNWATGGDYNRVRVVGVPGSFADHQIDVKKFMRSLEGFLGVRDWMILRRVCGENFQIGETIQDISPSYRYSTLTRFREALDALVEAIPKAIEARRKK